MQEICFRQQDVQSVDNTFTSAEQMHQNDTNERCEQITGLLFHDGVYRTDPFLQPSSAFALVYIFIHSPFAGLSLRDIRCSGAEMTLPNFRSIFTPLRQNLIKAYKSKLTFKKKKKKGIHCSTYHVKANDFVSNLQKITKTFCPCLDIMVTKEKHV